MAFEVIRRVTERGGYSNRLLPSLLERSGLPQRDRDLATELTYGTLRRMLAVDHALQPLLQRPIREAPPAARAALRLGAYQLLHTRVPDHAAVTESVSLVPPKQRGLVNAVLRRLAARPARPPGGRDDESIGIRTGLAPWAVAELRALLGDEAAAAAAGIAEHGPLTLRPNPCRTTREELEAALRDQGATPEPGRLHPDSLRLEHGDPRRLPGLKEGWFAVQDEASSWVVDVLDPKPGERVLDCCAGPGGKAGDIACRAGGVVAADLTYGRTKLATSTATRLGVRALALVQDARRPALQDGFDRVLVDAPCSGIGSARRRPELLWRPHPKDLPALAELQLGIASAAAGLLKPGGTLVYSVCTFPRAETDEVCDALLAGVPGLRPDPFPGPDGEPVERARVWPHRHGSDAMFVARFVRG